MQKKSILLVPTSVTFYLGVVAFCLVLVSLLLNSLVLQVDSPNPLLQSFRYWLDVNTEHNIPTFFSVLLLFFTTLLLVVITLLERQKIHWVVLSIGFLMMAFDEAISIHERVGERIKPMLLLGRDNLGIFYYAWVVPYLVIISLLALFFFRFWLHLPRQTRFTLAIAASLYLSGAMGGEMIGGYWHENYGTDNLTYSVIYTVEEGLEMAGVITGIRGLLVYIANSYQEVKFQFQTKQAYRKTPHRLKR